MSIGQWIKEARRVAGLTQTELGEKLGRTKGNVSAWEKDAHEPSFSQILEIAKLINWTPPPPGLESLFGTMSGATPTATQKQQNPWPFPSIDEAGVQALGPSQIGRLEGAIALTVAQLKLPVKVEPVRRPTSGNIVDMDDALDEFAPLSNTTLAPWEGGKTTNLAERERLHQVSDQTGVVTNVGVGEPPAANDKFERVPELADVRLAAGEPIENHAEEQTGMIQFRKSFLKAVGADNGMARVVYAKGDSMEPVIRDGAALLVVPNDSLTLRDLAAGGVYAINYDGKMIVKAVAKDRLTGRWVARSFNRSYDDIPLENGHPVRVLGQVVWAGARLRDDEAGQWIRS